MQEKIEILERLAALWKAGTLSDEEFTAEKTAVLGSLGDWPEGVEFPEEESDFKPHSVPVKTAIVGGGVAIAAAVCMTVFWPRQTIDDERAGTQRSVSTSSNDFAPPPSAPQVDRSENDPSLEEMARNDPDVSKFVCFGAQMFFVSGRGMEMMSSYAPEMTTTFYGRLPVMAKNITSLNQALTISRPGISWSSRAVSFSDRVPQTIHSRSDFLPIANLAWKCSGL